MGMSDAPLQETGICIERLRRPNPESDPHAVHRQARAPLSVSHYFKRSKVIFLHQGAVSIYIVPMQPKA